MKIPNVTIQQLLEAGVHLGHKTLRWNPKMKKYIFGKRDSIHILDLTQTLELTKIALEKVYETIANNGNAIDFGDLNNAIRHPGACSSQTRGLWGGGITPTNINNIDYVNMTTTGNAQDFGDLTKTTFAPAGLSDSHGGLGGF